MVKRRRDGSTTFVITSAEHQQIVLDALNSHYNAEPKRWKRNRILWLTRRLTTKLQLHEKKTAARQRCVSRAAKGLE
jgi:hypothetical protein